jgi:hypothetical protein
MLSNLQDDMWKRVDQVGLKRREDFNTLVNEPKAAQYVADFMIKAGLLGQFQTAVPLQEKPDGPSNTNIRGRRWVDRLDTATRLTRGVEASLGWQEAMTLSAAN